jgi:UDP-2,3-diacylglucosamine pyrophosphatase LpxH
MKNKYHMIAISDVHLGTPYCKSEKLLNFLKDNSSDSLYLIGDIVDAWHMGKNWYWDEEQENIVNHIMKRASISNVVLLTGNHEEANIVLPLTKFSPMEVLESCNYITTKGDKFLVAHGHQFDSNWLRTTSDLHFSVSILINDWYFGNGFFKKIAASIITNLLSTREKTLFKKIDKSLSLDYTGIICGHLHKPRVDIINNRLKYYNTGDWVSHCTYLTEDYEGNVELKTYV